MTVAILLLTHDLVGSSLLNAATRTFEKLPTNAFALPICNDCDPEQIIPQVENTIADLQNEDGILILTDLYGATPFNIAQRFNDGKNIRVIAGINLSMLIRVLNYANLELSSLCEKALTGGREGIIYCGCTEN